MYTFPAKALDIGFRLTPVVTFPVGSESTSVFSYGGGAFFNVDFDFLDHVSLGPEFGVTVSTLNGASSTVEFYSVGASVGGFYYPTSRIVTRAGASVGVFEAMNDSSTHVYSYWRAYLEGGFRFTPAFSLSASGGYISYMQNAPDNLNDCVTLGVSARYAIDTKPSRGNLSVTLDQQDPVFPLFFGMYRENGIGTLRIQNRESAEIRDVTVTFAAGNYTASPMPCATIPYLGKGQSVDVQLYADFAKTLFNFTEDGKIPGEVIVTYNLLGSRKTAAETVVVRVFNRNSVRWTDYSSLAAFASPNSPEVLDLGKYLVGIARGRLRTGLNRNMQFAMYLFEGLRAGGLVWSRDDSTPYVSYHRDPALIDFVQYPFQTLAYRSGDYDDIGLLVAALLESVGIKAAFIPLDGDFIVAFSLGIGPDEARGLFAEESRYLVLGDEVWIPLSTASFREGFVNSWYGAVQSLEPVLRGEASADVIALRDAWKVYPPTSITGNEAKFDKPAETLVAKAVDTAMLRYITAEFGPKIKSAQGRIRAQGGNATLYNELGLLYVRAGMYAEAKEEYRRSAKTGSVAAMVNLGNIALLERDFATASRWFREALAAQPDNRAAKGGLERARLELEE